MCVSSLQSGAMDIRNSKFKWKSRGSLRIILQYETGIYLSVVDGRSDLWRVCP